MREYSYIFLCVSKMNIIGLIGLEWHKGVYIITEYSILSELTIKPWSIAIIVYCQVIRHVYLYWRRNSSYI